MEQYKTSKPRFSAACEQLTSRVSVLLQPVATVKKVRKPSDLSKSSKAMSRKSTKPKQTVEPQLKLENNPMIRAASTLDHVRSEFKEDFKMKPIDPSPIQAKGYKLRSELSELRRHS